MSLVALFGKLAKSNFSLTSPIFWRFASAFFLCFILLSILGMIKRIFYVPNFKMHLLRAFFVLSSQYSFYYYIERNSLLNGTVLLSTGTLFIPLIERVLLKKRVGKSSWIGLAISFVGVLCILQPDKEIFSLAGIIGLFAGFSQGCSQIVFGINSKEERSDLGVLYLMFFCALFSLGPYLAGEVIEIGEIGGWGTLFLLGLALGVVSLFNQITRAEAYKHGSPSRLAVFLYFSVILAALWDWIIFHQTPNFISFVGAALVILGGVAKIYLRFQKRTQS